MSTSTPVMVATTSPSTSLDATFTSEVPVPTRGEGLYNASRYTLRVAEYDGATDQDRLPAVGSTVTPGGTIRFHVAERPLDAHTVIVRFEVIHPDGGARGFGYDVAFSTDGVGGSRRSALTVPDFVSHRLTREYVVVSDGRATAY